MKKFIVAALTALVAASVSAANARDEPSREAVEAFYHQLSQDAKKQRFSLRETANHLASSIWWSEKLQLLCPSYFYVNARRARYDYLLRQETWQAYFGVGKTATSILNEATARRNEEFNNVVGAAKGSWCESVKAFGIEHFGWAPLFEVGD
jgi:opacity protein-like surface antigen